MFEREFFLVPQRRNDFSTKSTGTVCKWHHQYLGCFFFYVQFFAMSQKTVSVTLLKTQFSLLKTFPNEKCCTFGGREIVYFVENFHSLKESDVFELKRQQIYLRPGGLLV
jgi:hypothetical protein